MGLFFSLNGTLNEFPKFIFVVADLKPKYLNHENYA